MRAVLIGASKIAVATARCLLEDGNEVVIIEEDEEKLDALSDELDCGFLHGDGSKPAILREASPDNTDVLMCLSGSDQDNIIAALIACALKFERVVVKIAEADYEPICKELGIEDLFLPDRETGRALADLALSEKSTGFTAKLEGDLRFFSLLAGEDETGPVSGLNLPEGARIVARNRDGSSETADEDCELRAGDVLLLVCDEARLGDLRERFREAGDGGIGAEET